MSYEINQKTLKTNINSGASLSGEIDIRGCKLFIIYMPSAWTTANLTFKVAEKSLSEGGTFQDLYDDTGSEVTVVAAASRAISVDLNITNLAAASFIQIRSGTTGTPVNQAADRIITIIGKG